ncbi:MAG TPA: DNA polymerase III subunit delta [Pelagibacteraceae bacterium]|nr:DNA polymerase III subunit delta [Pelagibacteraceae bacterium]
MILKSYELQKNPSNLLEYNLFLLYGENDGLKKDIKELIKIKKKQQDTNIELLSLYENDIINNEENFYNSIYSGSLFSNKRIIIINNGTDKILKQVKDIVDRYPNNVFLIIFSDILEKKSKLRNFFETSIKTLCIPCYLDSDKDLEIIVRTELKKSNIILQKDAINLLIERSNGDRNNLKNEIEKVKSFALNKKNLEIDEIKSIINFSGEYKADNLINECLCGNIPQYKKILSELYINTLNQIFLLRVLNNKIQRLLSMKELENSYNNLDSLLSTSKPPIFWKEKPMVKKQLTIWNLNDLKTIMHEINNIEILCKKNPQISKIIFFDFFSKLCKKANNYS